MNNVMRKHTELPKSQSLDQRTIIIDLHSEGGDLYAALAYSTLIRQALGMNIEVRIIVRGIVASAAVLILAYASQRYMFNEAWAMLHETSTEALEGNLTEIAQEHKQLEALEKQFSELLANNTKTSYSKWRQLHKGVTYLSAQECLKLGLIDKIL